MNPLKTSLIAALAGIALTAVAAPPQPPAPPKHAQPMSAPGSTTAVTPGERDAKGLRPISGRRTMAPDGEVRIHNVAGSIEVVAWDRSEVEISGTIGDEVERVEFGGGDGYTVVNVILPRRCVGGCDGDIRISVPRVARLQVDGTSADIKVTDAAGVIHAESISGEVILRTRSRDITGKSVSGDVEVVGNGADGRIEASSTSGDVTIEGVNASVRAESTSGDVKVERSKVTRLEVQSVSGDVSYSGSLAGSSEYSLQTTSGDVRLRIAGPRDATYELNTFSGDIDNAFGPSPRRTSEYAPGRELRFTEGRGAARVRANTLSGDIELATQ